MNLIVQNTFAILSAIFLITFVINWFFYHKWKKIFNNSRNNSELKNRKIGNKSKFEKIENRYNLYRSIFWITITLFLLCLIVALATVDWHKSIKDIVNVE